MTYTEMDYQRERAICDAAAAYVESILCEGGTKRRRNYLTAQEAAAPVYAACDNDMRGRVEQFELLRDLPERFVAYLEDGKPDYPGCRLAVTVWTGLPLGTATVRSAGENGRLCGRAIIGGAEYSWQGDGAGSYARFRKLKSRA